MALSLYKGGIEKNHALVQPFVFVLFKCTLLIWDAEHLFLFCFLFIECDPLLNEKPKHIFKNLLQEHGHSEKVVDELWKWYNFSEKKGVASF